MNHEVTVWMEVSMSREMISSVLVIGSLVVVSLLIVWFMHHFHALGKRRWVAFAARHGLSMREKQYHGVVVEGEYQGRSMRGGFDVYENSRGARQAEHFYEVMLHESVPYRVHVRARPRYGGGHLATTPTGNRKIDRKLIIEGINTPALQSWLSKPETHDALLHLIATSALAELRGSRLTYRRPINHLGELTGVKGFKKFHALAMRLERTFGQGV